MTTSGAPTLVDYMLNALKMWIVPTRKLPVRRRSVWRPALEILEDRCAPAVLTVNSLADTSTAGNALTLREAVQIVDGTLGRSLTTGEQAQVSGTLGSNDTIQFNLPSGPQTITLTGGTLQLTKSVTIVGPGAANLTISGNNAIRDLYIGSSYSKYLSVGVSISGVTIANGNQQYGSGIFNSGTLTMTNVAVSNNAATNNGGGGLYNTGAIILNGCTFSGNSTTTGNDGATSGGGLLNASGGTANFTNCLFTGNTAPGSGTTAGSGGAITNSGVMNLTSCTFTANSAGSDAGAFYTDGTATLLYCTFTGNSCGVDGGALHTNGATTISYCLVANNTSGSSAGGIEQSSIAGSTPNSLVMTNTSFINNTSHNTAGALVSYIAQATLTNDTFTGNRVLYGTSGGGIWAAAPLTLQNTIVAGNYQGAGTTPADIVGNVSSASSYNLIGTGGAGGLTNGGNHNQVGVANPGLGTLANNGGPTQTVAVLPGSPAIDQGNNAFVTSGETDQRGLNRVVNGTVDIGAFEYQGATSTAATTFTMTGWPSTVQAGATVTVTITARTATGSVAAGYTGTVHFSSSDAQAVLPANYTFVSGDNGVHTFNITLKSAGTQSVSVADTANASINVSQSGIAVTAVSVGPSPTGPVLIVNSTADSTTPDNLLTLREAIEIVDGTLGRPLTPAEQAQVGTLGANDVIEFNLPAGAQTITLTTGPLDITQAVTIQGPGAGSLTVSGNNLDRVFIVGQVWSPNPSLAVSIRGLTIAGGNQTYGGGLLNFGTLTLTNTTLANNTAGSSGGGGIYNVTALTLNGCTFTGNAVAGGSSAGGAILNISSGTATINNCTFNGNQANGTGTNAASGGAIGNAGTMTINGSTFAGNFAGSDGGAIYNDGNLTIGTSSFLNSKANSDGGAIRSDGTLSLSASTFAGNYAASVGGAIDTTDASMSAINCTFASNSAGSSGAAIMADAGTGTVVLTNGTITANTVSASGAVGGGIDAGRPVTLHNTIVAGNFHASNAADDVAGTVDASSSYNLVGTGGAGGLQNGVNHNLVGVANPQLGPLANNGGPTQTIALLSGSPASGAGSNAFVTSGETDQRGLPRVVNGTVDIGAYENQSPPQPSSTPPSSSPATSSTPPTSSSPSPSNNPAPSNNVQNWGSWLAALIAAIRSGNGW